MDVCAQCGMHALLLLYTAGLFCFWTAPPLLAAVPRHLAGKIVWHDIGGWKLPIKNPPVIIVVIVVYSLFLPGNRLQVVCSASAVCSLPSSSVDQWCCCSAAAAAAAAFLRQLLVSSSVRFTFTLVIALRRMRRTRTENTNQRRRRDDESESKYVALFLLVYWLNLFFSSLDHNSFSFNKDNAQCPFRSIVSCIND